MAATLTQAGKKRGYYHIPKRDGTKAEVIAEIQAGVPRSKAPGCAGVSRECFYNWLEQDRQFAFEVEQAESLLTKARLQAVQTSALESYKDRSDTKTLYRLLEVSSPEFRTGPDTLINIGQIGNNTLVVSDEKVEALRKLRDRVTTRKTEKLADAKDISGNHDASSGRHGNLSQAPSKAQQSSSAYLLGKALTTIKEPSLKKLPE